MSEVATRDEWEFQPSHAMALKPRYWKRILDDLKQANRDDETSMIRLFTGFSQMSREEKQRISTESQVYAAVAVEREEIISLIQDHLHYEIGS